MVMVSRRTKNVAQKNIEKYGSKKTYQKAYNKDYESLVEVLEFLGVTIPRFQKMLIDIPKNELGDMPEIKFQFVIPHIALGAIVIGDKSNIDPYFLDYRSFNFF